MADRPGTAIAFDAAAVVCAAGAGAAILWGDPGNPTAALLVGATGVTLAGGAAAAVDATGRLIDGVSGLLVQALILTPLAWVFRDAAPVASAMSLAVVGLGLLAFYVVARARSLSFPAPGGILVRALAASAVAAALAVGGPMQGTGAVGDQPPLMILRGIDWVVAFLLAAAVIEAAGAAYIAYRVTIAPEAA